MKREELNLKDTWDLTLMYKNDELFWENFNKFEAEITNISKYQNKLKKSSKDLLEVLKYYNDTTCEMSHIYVYAHLKNDQDTTNGVYKEMYMKTSSLYTKFSTEWAFFEPELLELKNGDLKNYILELPELKEYEFLLEKITSKKNYTLDKEQEKIITMAGDALSASSNTFSMLNNADVKFDDIKDSNGNVHKLTHGTFGTYLESKDRVLRKNAFDSVYKYYKEHINTLSSTLFGEIKGNLFYAKSHKYNSVRHNALSDNFIKEEIYDNLIKVVNNKLNSLHKYHKLQKKIFGYDDLHLYDKYVSMIEAKPMKFTFDEAKEIVLNAMKPLGNDYVNDMRKAFDERWIDIYPNDGKRSGAYSSGTYSSKPYILLNYDGTLDDVFTLAHELGHSMHSYYSRERQTYMYSSYPIFLAEVASTCNEALLSDYLYKKFENENNKDAMLMVLNQELSGFVGTIYRQTMFAEFEHIINTEVENGGALTAEFLNGKYFDLVKKYHGDAFEYDEAISYEWSRIPHFYYRYYVYQYATGCSAAKALSSLILEDEKNALIYINEFLSKGCSNYPLEILKNAGVDMETSEPIERALEIFDKKIDQFEKLYFEGK